MRLITVGSAAQALGCSPETIRSYARRGLIQPARDSKGRRLLTDADLEKLREYRKARVGQQQPSHR